MFPVGVLLLFGGYWLLYDGIQRVEHRSDWGLFGTIAKAAGGVSNAGTVVGGVAGGAFGTKTTGTAKTVEHGLSPISWLTNP